jgi:O-antigen/teichoic acid export membrane protein
MNRAKYFSQSIFMNFFAKTFDAILKFASFPILLAFFGKEQYSIVILVGSINAYIAFLDLGMNTGVITFLAKWKSSGDETRVRKLIRANISFYLAVGCVSALLLATLAATDGYSALGVRPEDAAAFRALLIR